MASVRKQSPVTIAVAGVIVVVASFMNAPEGGGPFDLIQRTLAGEDVNRGPLAVAALGAGMVGVALVLHLSRPPSSWS